MKNLEQIKPLLANIVVAFGVFGTLVSASGFLYVGIPMLLTALVCFVARLDMWAFEDEWN